MEEHLKKIMKENLDMMKIILVGLRREVMINQKNIQSSSDYDLFLKSIDDYMGCMRDARRLGIFLKDVINMYKDIDEIMELRKKSGQTDSLVFKFNEPQQDISKLN